MKQPTKASLKYDLKIAQADLTGHKARVEQLETDIRDLERQISSLRGYHAKIRDQAERVLSCGQHYKVHEIDSIPDRFIKEILHLINMIDPADKLRLYQTPVLKHLDLSSVEETTINLLLYNSGIYTAALNPIAKIIRKLFLVLPAINRAHFPELDCAICKSSYYNG